ncbi:MAG: glycosyltransferase family 4 protein, partial [Candidatus Binatia bacterium]
QVPFFLTAMTYSLLRLLARQRFDVIHAHWLLPQGWVGLIGAGIFNIPLIVTAHGTDAFALRGRFANHLKRRILIGAAAWTANTAATAAAVTRDARLPAPRIIPMGVDLVLFSSGKRTALRGEIHDGEHVVLFVGRLIENKGCQDLIEAVSHLSPKAQSQTSLWIVGVGDQQTQLERSAHKFGVAARVKFVGAVEQQRLPEFYAAADVVVVPSKLGSAGATEGQSVVVLEAFAARACVLATRIGGIPSMVHDQLTGMLVEPGNPRSLSEALELLMTNPDLRRQLSENAFAEIDQYSWQRIAGEFHRLYDETVNSAPR